MYNAVLELGKLAAVPAVGSANQISSDALQSVNVMAVAAGALFKALGGVLIATVHAAVAVVIHRAVAHIVLVHKVNNIGDCFWIMCSVTVNLYIEDVAATGEIMIGRFHLGFVLRRALVIDRNVVAVGVINLIGHTRDFTEILAVATGEFSTETLGWRRKHTVVVLITFTEFVDAVAHVGDNLKPQLLSLVALAMMMSNKGNQALSQSNEANAQGALVDDTLHLVVRTKLAGAIPQL